MSLSLSVQNPSVHSHIVKLKILTKAHKLGATYIII